MRYEDAASFKEENGYDINGIWYPRVTRILSIKAKPALENFLKEVGNYNQVENIKNKSAEEGSVLHGLIQNILVDKTITIPKAAEPSVFAFQRFNQNKKIKLYPEFVEKQITSIRHRYAGTVDGLAEIDGKFGVLDIKTSAGFYPEYNLQTAAYVSALQEFEVKKNLFLPRVVETRWILRIDQSRNCRKCGSKLREKGGRNKIRSGLATACAEGEHEWKEAEGEVELREFPYLYKDTRAFIAAKILWEWENDYWLRRIGYLK